MNLGERLRKFGFNPQFLKRPEKEIQPPEVVSEHRKPETINQESPTITREFFDPKLQLSFLSDDTAINLLNRKAQEEDTETKERDQGHFQLFLPENEEGIVPGLYYQTTVTADEWDDSMLVRHAYGSIIDSALEQNGIIGRGQPIMVNAEYISPD